MMKESTLNKKLKSYSALAGSLIAVGSSADAQVVYTNVDPDTTVITNGFYDLDLNNDGLMDFNLTQMAGTYYGYVYNVAYATPIEPLSAIDTSSANGLANAVDHGFEVDSTRNWCDLAGTAATYASLLALDVPGFYTLGNFLGQTGKFLPLRLDLEGDTYYGWVRLTIPANATTITIIDYAYQAASGGTSVTGSLVGISEAAMSGKVNIYSFDHTITVKLDPQVPAEGNIIVRNMLGQTIKEVAVTGSEMVIPVNDVKDGAYTVTLTQKDGGYTRKVIIK